MTRLFKWLKVAKVWIFENCKDCTSSASIEYHFWYFFCQKYKATNGTVTWGEKHEKSCDQMKEEVWAKYKTKLTFATLFLAKFWGSFWSSSHHPEHFSINSLLRLLAQFWVMQGGVLIVMLSAHYATAPPRSRFKATNTCIIKQQSAPDTCFYATYPSSSSSSKAHTNPNQNESKVKSHSKLKLWTCCM